MVGVGVVSWAKEGFGKNFMFSRFDSIWKFWCGSGGAPSLNLVRFGTRFLFLQLSSPLLF